MGYDHPTNANHDANRRGMEAYTAQQGMKGGGHNGGGNRGGGNRGGGHKSGERRRGVDPVVGIADPMPDPTARGPDPKASPTDLQTPLLPRGPSGVGCRGGAGEGSEREDLHHGSRAMGSSTVGSSTVGSSTVGSSTVRSKAVGSRAVTRCFKKVDLWAWSSKVGLRRDLWA